MRRTRAGYPRPFIWVAALLLGLGLWLTFPASPTIRGELLFSDSFDYPPGDLDGQGPPPGSPPGQGGWVKVSRHPQVAAFGLDFPGIFTSGNCARMHGYSDEAFATIGPVTPDIGVVWIGFLARKAPASKTGGYAVVVAIGASISDPSVGIGDLSTNNRYGLDNDTGDLGSRSATRVLVDENTDWLVTKFDFINGWEYLWVNPSPAFEPDIAHADAQLPMTPAFRAVGFPYLRLRVGYANAIFQFDELRVGTNFVDVVNPETGF